MFTLTPLFIYNYKNCISITNYLVQLEVKPWVLKFCPLPPPIEPWLICRREVNPCPGYSSASTGGQCRQLIVAEAQFCQVAQLPQALG